MPWTPRTPPRTPTARRPGDRLGRERPGVQATSHQPPATGHRPRGDQTTKTTRPPGRTSASLLGLAKLRTRARRASRLDRASRPLACFFRRASCRLEIEMQLARRKKPRAACGVRSEGGVGDARNGDRLHPRAVQPSGRGATNIGRRGRRPGGGGPGGEAGRRGRGEGGAGGKGGRGEGGPRGREAGRRGREIARD